MLARTGLVRYQYPLIGGCIVTLTLLFLFYGNQRPTLPNFGMGSSSSLDFLDDTKNATLGFQKIYAITLPTRVDQRDALALSAAALGLQIDWIEGALGDEIANKSLPPKMEDAGLSSGVKGCWRAHMDTYHTIVEQNINTALVLEADADWDIRIKEQMQDFARSSNALLQPLASSSKTVKYADPSFPHPEPDQRPLDLSFDTLPKTILPSMSPYGDDWHILWLGHCGVNWPEYKEDHQTPLGRVIRRDDPTVPETQYLKYWYGTNELFKKYPNHTSAVSHASGAVCTTAYAISQAGARSALYSIGIAENSAPIDIALRGWCDGSYGREYHRCLAPQPQLFHQHRPKGYKASYSDLGSDKDKEYSDQAYTRHIRWSARVNLPRLTEGRTDYIDQWPDGEEFTHPEWY